MRQMDISSTYATKSVNHMNASTEHLFLNNNLGVTFSFDHVLAAGYLLCSYDLGSKGDENGIALSCNPDVS